MSTLATQCVHVFYYLAQNYTIKVIASMVARLIVFVQINN